MTPALRRQIEALGPALTPSMMRATQEIFAANCRPMDSSIQVTRDHAYGPDERHRLDVFTRPGLAGVPVLVFVHGGGFVMGDKRAPGLPYYDNIGGFAVEHGMVGVTLTYRLAPAHRWPAGPDDMAAAVDWLLEHVAEFGGDPERIFLMGQSAGATHVANYVTHREPRIAGALLISCLYENAGPVANDFHRAYYGDDLEVYAASSAQAGLITTSVPLLCSVSEFDMPEFQASAARFAAAYGAARGAYPPLLWLQGHNHLSPVLAIGSPGETLGPEILAFIAGQTA
jgi:triacylglycerol lipase